MRNLSSNQPWDLRERTSDFALQIIEVFGVIRRSDVGQILGRQLLRSGTSVGAQYREACRARSSAEFVSKLESAQQELDETGYWLELLEKSGVVVDPRLPLLRKEVDELLAIFSASARTAKQNKNSKSRSG